MEDVADHRRRLQHERRRRSSRSTRASTASCTRVRDRHRLERLGRVEAALAEHHARRRRPACAPPLRCRRDCPARFSSIAARVSCGMSPPRNRFFTIARAAAGPSGSSSTSTWRAGELRARERDAPGRRLGEARPEGVQEQDRPLLGQPQQRFEQLHGREIRPVEIVHQRPRGVARRSPPAAAGRSRSAHQLLERVALDAPRAARARRRAAPLRPDRRAAAPSPRCDRAAARRRRLELRTRGGGIVVVGDPGRRAQQIGDRVIAECRPSRASALRARRARSASLVRSSASRRDFPSPASATTLATPPCPSASAPRAPSRSAASSLSRPTSSEKPCARRRGARDAGVRRGRSELPGRAAAPPRPASTRRSELANSKTSRTARCVASSTQIRPPRRECVSTSARST